MLFEICFVHFQFFLAPPERVPNPRWYYLRFTDVFEAFVTSAMGLQPNVHLCSLFSADNSMFELDGRHYKSANGKDYIDSLLAQADAGMVKVSLDTDVRLAGEENRLTAVEGRVDLVRLDLSRNTNRLNVVVARAAEDGDALINEKYVFSLSF